jgi:DNA-binding PadR family transcriptional regulator
MSYLMRAITERGSLWELAVLSLLREQPMHPYEMQRLLKERHEVEVLALKRGSLYHAINRLTRSGLIEPVTVRREGRRPERTTYRLTASGEPEFVRRLRQRIATLQREPPEFMGSVSFLVHLVPRDALAQLQSRARALESEIGALAGAIKEIGPHLARIHLIEREYLLAMHKAELEWLRGLTGELSSGRFAWDLKRILREVRAARRRTAARKER